MKYLILTIVFCISIITVTRAGGPWTQKKGKLYFQFDYNIIPTSNKLFFTADGGNFLSLPRAITDQTLGIYAEYGLSDKFTFIANIPYKITKSSEKDFTSQTPIQLPDPLFAESGNLNAFGNITLTGKYQLYKKDILLAADITLLFPTGSRDIATKLRTGYDTYGVQPSIHLGYSKEKLYASSNIAYHYRTDLIDEIKLSAEVGYKVYKDLYAIIAINILQSTESIQPRSEDFPYLYQDQQEYFASTLKFSKVVYKNMGLNLHMTIATTNANYVQEGPAIGGSVYFKF